MAFFDELGLKAAEQLESAVGPFVALASYKRLLAAPVEVRVPAVLGALRCAVSLLDEREVRELAAAWSALPKVDRGRAIPVAEAERTSSIGGLVVRLSSAGRNDLAFELATAEVTRQPSAHARYVLARASELACGPDLALWASAIDAAHDEGKAALLVRTVARFIELALFSSAIPRLARPARGEIAHRAGLPDLAGATPIERLVILRARLLSPGKFARAAALSGLEELARTGPRDIREHAVLACARHVDMAGDALGAVEIDRARAALASWPRAPEKDRALARLDARSELQRLVSSGAPDAASIDRAASLVETSEPLLAPLVHRARVMARGGSGGGAASASEPSSSRLASWGLDAVAAIGREQDASAAAALTRAAEAMPPLAVVPPMLWAGARVALRSKSAGTRRAAATLVEQALSRSASAPPCGFATLASDLSRSGFAMPAELALREAVRLREPGAARSLGGVVRGLGYEALARGDRKRALDALREARELSRGNSR